MNDRPANTEAASDALARLARVRIVLVGAQHPGNIGAVARAMKVMGLSDLALVAPQRFPDNEADARASGATDILAAARVTDDLDAAIADCVHVIGTSARTRRTEWPQVGPADAARLALDHSVHGSTALVFGCERSGLDNAALDRCQHHVQIPTNSDYGSLNLAAAVQIMTYELRCRALASAGPVPSTATHHPASAADMEGLYGHMRTALEASGFLNPANPGVLMRRMRRLFNRAAPDRTEVNILRGALRALSQAGNGRDNEH